MLTLSLAGRASRADGAAKPPTLVVGSDAPALSVLGWWQDRELPELEKGNIYVVDFWASWCGPCRKSMPHLLGLRKRYNDQSIQFVGISIDSNPDDASKYLTGIGANRMPILFAVDDNHKTWSAWGHAAGRHTIPTTFLIGRDGKIAWIGNPLKLDDELQKLVG